MTGQMKMLTGITITGVLLLVLAVSCSSGGSSTNPPPPPSPSPVPPPPPGGTTGTLTINVIGLPAAVPANIAVTGPNNYAKMISSTTTLSNLPVGTYSIQSGFSTTAGTAYTGLPAIQQATVSATPAQANINFSNYTLPGIVVSGTTCTGVAIGTSCTIKVELVNNADKIGIITGIVKGTDKIKYVSHQAGPMVACCGITTGAGVSSTILSFVSTSNNATNSMSGNGVIVTYTVQRTASGLSRLEVQDAKLGGIGIPWKYLENTLFFFE